MVTKQEVINFLESKLGTVVPCPPNPALRGQCVTLIKALLEFLGAPDPYKARGHAATVISAYLSEGIASPGAGVLTVYSNKNMASPYGHIWCSINNTFYESNGAKPLTVTKGKTYAYDNICNFDKYIGGTMNELLVYLGVSNEAEAKAKLKEHLGENNSKCDWGNEVNGGGFLGSARRANRSLETQIKDLKEEIEDLNAQIADHVCPITPPSEPNLNGKLNGYTKTYVKDGVTITENYAV